MKSEASKNYFGNSTVENLLYQPVQKRLQTSQKQQKDLKKLRTVINKLVVKEALEVKYKDHPLTGNWKGFRDCHLEPDWLLIYKSSEDTLILERTGSHSELFKK